MIAAALGTFRPGLASPQGSAWGDDEGLHGGGGAGRFASPPQSDERLATVRTAVNPLLEAAQPLLRAMCDLPDTLDPEGLARLHELLAQEVTRFRALCDQAGVRHDHMLAASYALCTAIDEAVQRRPWGGGVGTEAGAWGASPLAQQFHEDTKGGERVFQLIGRLAAAPREHVELLELMFYLLALGFEGQYRTQAQGRRHLEMLRLGLHDMVMAARAEVPRALSPHWRGAVARRWQRLWRLRGVPVWVTAVLLSLALLAQFGWYRYRLARSGDSVVSGIRALAELSPAPAPPRRALRLKALLAPEIARQTVSVDEDDSHSAVSFRGDDMFVPGQAQVNTRLAPTVAKVANEVKSVSGTVRVTGHSDNRPIRTRAFPDNQALSEQRASAVAEMLAQAGVPRERLVVEGRGDAQPLADNGTAAGRARNRRVDIVVTQEGPGGIGTTGPSAARGPAS